MRQVALERRSAQGRYQDVAWIDADMARVGKRVRVEGTDEVWEIVEVYGTRRREFVEGSRAARKHFKETIG